MNDYIKREDAIAAVKHAWAKGLNPVEYIEILSSADVAPVKRGWWRMDGLNIQTSVITCSVCGFEPMYDCEKPLLNYCPNCGADMRATLMSLTKEVDG